MGDRHAVSRRQATTPAAAARAIRGQVVRIDLALDHMERARDGLSRADLVTLLADLDGIGSALSEVADTLEHVAP